MRQWLIPTHLLCNQHLLGEHVEHHMFVGCINKGTSIKGYVSNGLIETNSLQKRHTEIVNEMKLRGFNHQSKLAKFIYPKMGHVDIEANIKELYRRCSKCRKLIREEVKI